METETWYPIWDKDARHILLDETGQEIWMHPGDVTRNISRQKLGVWRPRNSRSSERRIFLKVDPEELFERAVRRLTPSQPFCIRLKVGEKYHCYIHHRERCEASYDGRSLYVGSNGNGEKVFLKPGINGSCL